MITYNTIYTPNYDKHIIDVEFVVIHYTAGSLKRALSLFANPAKQVSAHLVIDITGETIEIVPCLKGTTYKAWHAGESHWVDTNNFWQNFNDFSIGIELVNLNGNIFEYTNEQYNALAKILTHLKDIYPPLKSIERIVGHEHIAGWRGKADPGLFFDWQRLFNLCYQDQIQPKRDFVCPDQLHESLVKFLPFIPSDSNKQIQFWHAMSYITETTIQLMHKK